MLIHHVQQYPGNKTLPHYLHQRKTAVFTATP